MTHVVGPTLAVASADSTADLERELRRLRLVLARTQQEYHDLLAAARAAAAAVARGDSDPIFWVTCELAAHGQVPNAGAIPEQVAAVTRWPRSA